MQGPVFIWVCCHSKVDLISSSVLLQANPPQYHQFLDIYIFFMYHKAYGFCNPGLYSYLCLMFQHRMRPEIARLLTPHIYSELENHASVLDYENVKVGIVSCVLLMPEVRFHTTGSVLKPSRYYDDIFSAAQMSAMQRVIMHIVTMTSLLADRG